MTEKGTYYGSAYDRYVESTEDSTTHKLKSAFWTTKQVVIKKFGRKEDEHVVASDCALDAKLELFRSIERTCNDLSRIIDRYQDKICVLSQAENELGRFLKTHGTEDKTNAGKMMTAVGKSLSFSAQQRLALRVPLSRLQQEVDTFSQRAVSDTLLTVLKMEQSRTDYRAALLWMRDVSENLDPDTFKQLDKFRKVQAQVRKTKSKFEKVKLDSMQKVDLLAASRCNMFSNILGLYQSTLLLFWKKTCKTMVAVADSFQGYQYYEFSMLKHLTDDSRRLADLTGGQPKEIEDFFGEDSKDNMTDEEILNIGEDIVKDKTDDCMPEKFGKNRKPQSLINSKEDNDLLLMQESKCKDNFEELNNCLNDIFTSNYTGDPDNDIKDAMEKNKLTTSRKEDLFGLGLADVDDQSNDKEFIEDLLFTEDNSLIKGTDGKQCDQQPVDKYDWAFLFGSDNESNTALSQTVSSNSQMLAELMPSSLLDSCSNLTESNSAVDPRPCSEYFKSKIDKKDNNAAWLSMFADLDPLANPDALSKKEGQITDT